MRSIEGLRMTNRNNFLDEGAGALEEVGLVKSAVR